MIQRSVFVVLFFLLVSSAAVAQTWKPLGPLGGDVHSLAADPAHPGHIFLGTADGHLFGSADAGEHWALLGRVSTRQDAVIPAMVVDPRDANVVFASAWTQNPAAAKVWRDRWIKMGQDF